MGNDESHFNVSLIVRDKVTTQCPQTTTFLKRKESKRNWAEALLLTSLTPYLLAKPTHKCGTWPCTLDRDNKPLAFESECSWALPRQRLSRPSFCLLTEITGSGASFWRSLGWLVSSCPDFHVQPTTLWNLFAFHRFSYSNVSLESTAQCFVNRSVKPVCFSLLVIFQGLVRVNRPTSRQPCCATLFFIVSHIPTSVNRTNATFNCIVSHIPTSIHSTVFCFVFLLFLIFQRPYTVLCNLFVFQVIVSHMPTAVNRTVQPVAHIPTSVSRTVQPVCFSLFLIFQPPSTVLFSLFLIFQRSSAVCATCLLFIVSHIPTSVHRTVQPLCFSSHCFSYSNVRQRYCSTCFFLSVVSHIPTFVSRVCNLFVFQVIVSHIPTFVSRMRNLFVFQVIVSHIPTFYQPYVQPVCFSSHCLSYSNVSLVKHTVQLFGFHWLSYSNIRQP